MVDILNRWFGRLRGWFGRLWGGWSNELLLLVANGRTFGVRNGNVVTNSNDGNEYDDNDYTGYLVSLIDQV